MITNYQDLLSYQDGEEAIGLSNEIPLDDILQCSKASNNVFYTIFGYVPMYQTYRQIVSLYKEHKNLHFTNDHLYLQEATRLDSYCPILENEYGSVIFRDGTISILEQYEKVQLCKYVYLEGIFISNDVFDQVIDIYIKVFRGKLDVNEGLMMMKQLPLTYNNVFMNQDSKYDPKEFE
jgi:hypothetical protein